MSAPLPEPHTMSPEAMLDELAAYLRPPGQGIYTVSTGRSELEAATRRYLDREPIAWRDHLDALRFLKEQVAILALPSDVGAGFVRGASFGPAAIREWFGTAPAFDLGDVFTVPHFLDEESLSETQIARSRAALYPFDPEGPRPVSPIGMTTRVVRLLKELRPDLRLLLLGGDHTVTWPLLDALLGPPEQNQDVGIVHFDAHTDLLPARLGVRYCFATWAYHVNERIGRGERMVQLGIRASSKPQAHWEQTTGVKQIWAEEARALGPTRLAERVTDHLISRGVKRVYISNDLDGTDESVAAACGTPEPGGLLREDVFAVLDAIGRGPFEVFGADLVELAPVLSLDRQAVRRSIETAGLYVRRELALLSRRS